jgi:predicted molibdopterin-dependent oxidoreductase YjgC
MEEYISQVSLSVNGREITDFNSFTPPSIVPRVTIPVMNKTGFVRKKVRFVDIKVGYVVPKNKEEFDWESVENGTLTVDYENGNRVTYIGVVTTGIDEGSVEADSDNALVKEITLAAEDRKNE